MRNSLFQIPKLRQAQVVLGLCSFVCSTIAQVRNPAAGHTDLTGIWNSATATPLERPAKLQGKAFFMPDEANEWERRTAEQNTDGAVALASTGVGTYNVAYREFGTKVVKTLRTSIIIDPPDGRIPPLTPAAAAEKRRHQQLLRNPGGPADLGLQDRCLAFVTAGPPMLPYSYNSNYQIIQTERHVIIHAEMAHDTRIVHMDGRPHLPQNVRLWLGDSIGRWQGNTLVVDTTNFNDAGGFYGDAGGMFGWDRNLHVIERFSLFDTNTILYQFEIDDPTAFTSPWKGELTMTRSSGPIYEYACQEGNYALANLLNAFLGR
ncbi:MAG: hypothetical protein C5B51_08770 [Terriglobia bacterium]|nr:MAG: hypothetical protein C5B51_08770 [Terriglobia bacterium]